MRVNSRGRVTIPKELMEQFDLHPGDEVEFEPIDESRILVRKKGAAGHPVDRLKGIGKLPFGKDVGDYIEQARGH